MAESSCRVLRDGSLEGELAPSLAIKDSILSPLAINVFDYALSQMSSYILAGKSQSKGLIIVAVSRSPSFYVDFLHKSGFDVDSSKWVSILDCFSDPLGWKQRLKGSGQVGSCPESSVGVKVCRDIRNVEILLSQILELGRGVVGPGKDRFCVAIDSVTELLRDVPLSSVAALLSNIRCHELVSSAFWVLHSDVHDTKTNAALEYMWSIVATVEGATHQEGVSLFERNARKAMLRVRLKRRNGRVRLMSEEIHIEQSKLKFLPVSSEDESGAQSLLPKVQFNLQLSEKEQTDRSRVVLPFEHQEKEKAEQIYDGRRSVMVGQNVLENDAEKSLTTDNSGIGEIVYIRDSDDERPDSDEDPDDDLDI